MPTALPALDAALMAVSYTHLDVYKRQNKASAKDQDNEFDDWIIPGCNGFK